METLWQNHYQYVALKNPKKIPSMRKLDLIIQGILDEDKTGCLFVVNIKFDTKNANEKQLFVNELFHQFLRK